jgi:hypothetical protein
MIDSFIFLCPVPLSLSSLLLQATPLCWRLDASQQGICFVLTGAGSVEQLALSPALVAWLGHNGEIVFEELLECCRSEDLVNYATLEVWFFVYYFRIKNY